MTGNGNGASPAAIRLMTAAVAALPSAPTDPAERARWLSEVEDLAIGLYRQAQSLDAQIDQLAACTPITGVLLSVTESHGRGVLTLHPTMGKDANDPDATEDLRTPWLSERRGASLFAQAQALIGATCRFGKYYEKRQDGSGRDVRMVAWIEVLAAERPAPSTSSVTNTEQPWIEKGGKQPPNPPPPAQAVASPPPPLPGSGDGPAQPDIGTLRNRKMATWRDLTIAAEEHFGIPEEKVWEVAMECYGAAGPNNPAQFQKTWNRVVSRYLPAA